MWINLYLFVSFWLRIPFFNSIIEGISVSADSPRLYIYANQRSDKAGIHRLFLGSFDRNSNQQQKAGKQATETPQSSVRSQIIFRFSPAAMWQHIMRRFSQKYFVKIKRPSLAAEAAAAATNAAYLSASKCLLWLFCASGMTIRYKVPHSASARWKAALFMKRNKMRKCDDEKLFIVLMRLPNIYWKILIWGSAKSIRKMAFFLLSFLACLGSAYTKRIDDIRPATNTTFIIAFISYGFVKIKWGKYPVRRSIPRQGLEQNSYTNLEFQSFEQKVDIYRGGIWKPLIS